MRRILSCSIALASSATVLSSCAALPEPPESLAAYWYARTDPHGYVASIGYFTPAQMRDADWEFRRIQNAAGSLCTGYRYAVRRDVQWFKTRPGSHGRCARVIYSFRCMAEADIGKPIPPDALEATRAHIMSQPVEKPLEPDCGEKDSTKIHRPRPQPDAPAHPAGAMPHQQ